MAACDPTLESFALFVDSLAPLIRYTADTDMVLNNLERFFKATRSPLTLISLFQRDRMSLPTLLEIFSTSQYLCDILITDPELFETVRQTEGSPMALNQMLDELVGEVDALEKDSLALGCLRRFKRRHILRIAYGDIIKKQPLEIVTRQLSRIADVAVEAALHAAGRRLFQKRGTPRAPNGTPAHFVILALGKLGGRELN
jgi:glutamate-ammonia-ligase adenylyltransferase